MDQSGSLHNIVDADFCPLTLLPFCCCFAAAAAGSVTLLLGTDLGLLLLQLRVVGCSPIILYRCRLLLVTVSVVH